MWLAVVAATGVPSAMVMVPAACAAATGHTGIFMGKTNDQIAALQKELMANFSHANGKVNIDFKHLMSRFNMTRKAARADADESSFHYHRMKWVLILVSIVAVLSIALVAFLCMDDLVQKQYAKKGYIPVPGLQMDTVNPRA